MSQLRLRASPPAVPPGLVRRRQVDATLSRGVTKPVTLICAGPGSGKTLSVASWLSGDGGRAGAWLTVDQTDNDLTTFWGDLLGALSVSAVLPAGSAVLDVVPAPTFGQSQALQVRAGLADLPTPVVLVLDDFQEITDSAVLDSLDRLIDHQPPNLRLVLITRSDPALRLHRLRVAGGLVEIRSRDLAFDEAEAAELFHRSDVELTDEQVRVLLDRTQGWPAGLRLAAMSLDADDPTNGIAKFTGTTRSVAEYFVGEVLDRLTQLEREFLLKTSITERLNSALATTLTGRTDSRSIIDSLVTNNAFVVSIVAGPDTWIRYHPLLRELLQHRLAVELPGSTEGLHLLAAGWFITEGEPIAALRHATLARAWDEVGRILTGTALPLMLTTAGPSLAAALEPAASRAITEPTLSTLLAASVCHYHRHDIVSMLRDGQAAAEFLAVADDDLRIPAEILIAITEVVFDRITGAGAVVGSSTRLLTLLDRAPRRLVPAAPHYRVIGLNNLGAGQLWAGDLADAGSSLTAALTSARELGMGLAEISARANLSVLQVIDGQLGAAHADASTAQQGVDRRGWASEPQSLGLYVALGMTFLAWDRLGDAADVIATGLAASSTGSDANCRLALGITTVGLAVARGDVAAARAAGARLGVELGNVEDRPELLVRWCAVAQAQVRLISGDPAAAVGCVQQPRRDDRGYAAALERVVLAKAHLAGRRPDLLPDLLAPLLEPGLPFVASAVEAKVLIAVAAHQQKRDTAALDAITAAIELARSEGIRRPFLDAGPVAAALIGRHRQVVTKHLDFTDKLLPAAQVTGRPAPAPATEQLTDRELIVLRYLPTMLKAAEIAKDLFVTINTVKSHQRSIYRKLDVTTRRAAVERARDLNLL